MVDDAKMAAGDAIDQVTASSAELLEQAKALEEEKKAQLLKK
jgi:hypothetical protein